MRAAAKIHEVALTIERNHFTRRNRRDDFSLVVFAQSLEEVDGFFTRHFFAHDRNIFLDELIHTSFDRLQIFGRKSAGVGKVVVKAVFDRRSDRDLCLGKELLDGLSHQVSSRVTNNLKPFGVACRDDRNRSIAVNHVREIHQLAVHTSG